jgi:competence protein ComEC
MKRILIAVALLFCAGIIAGRLVKPDFWLTYSAAVVFLVLSFLPVKRHPVSAIFLSCAVCVFAMALYSNSAQRPVCTIAEYIVPGSDSACGVKGYIENDPVMAGTTTVFVFRAREISFNNATYSCRGKILVRVKGEVCLRYAEELVIFGNIHRPFGKINSAGKSYRDFLSARDIWAIMNVKASGYVVRLHKKSGLAVKSLPFWLKARIERIVYHYLPVLPAGIIDAMVLGEKRNIPANINNSMIKSGTVHILVVSGFNVGIVCFIIVVCLKLIRIPRKPRLSIACVILVVYSVMTGASTPVVRAAIMAIVYMCSYFIKREPDIYNSLCLAAIGIFIINPRQLFDIGFQLSFASVISIVYFYPRITACLKVESVKSKFLRFFIDGAIVSVSAWLGTAGIIAYYFKIISPITVLANLFIVPLAALITVCGFSLVILGFVWPALASVCSYSVELLVLLLLHINNFLIKIPGAYFYLPLGNK